MNGAFAVVEVAVELAAGGRAAVGELCGSNAAGSGTRARIGRSLQQR